MCSGRRAALTRTSMPVTRLQVSQTAMAWENSWRKTVKSLKGLRSAECHSTATAAR